MPLACLFVLGVTALAQEDLTVTAAPATVVYGTGVTLTGTIPSRLASAGVQIVAEREDGPPASVASLAPGVTGFRITVKPRIRTVFTAMAAGETSAPAVVNVRPRVTLTRQGDVFVARVVAAHSFSGRTVVLQRLTRRGRWVPLKRAVLRRNPLRVKLTLPPGRTRIRAYVARSRAEPGYLDGFSPPLTVRAPRVRTPA